MELDGWGWGEGAVAHSALACFALCGEWVEEVGRSKYDRYLVGVCGVARGALLEVVGWCKSSLFVWVCIHHAFVSRWLLFILQI